MYLGIYLKKNNQKKKRKKKKEKKNEERREWAGLEPRTFGSLRTLPNYYTTKADYVTLSKVFYLIPFPRKIHRQTSLKMIEPRKTALLTVFF